MSFTDWQSTVPADLTGDALWGRQDYRLALYAADLGWQDIRRLSRVRATADVAERLGRSLGSITANIAEGHGRSSGTDRARFYGYALGSVRESQEWYQRARHVLGADVTRRRVRVLSTIARRLAETSRPASMNARTRPVVPPCLPD